MPCVCILVTSMWQPHLSTSTSINRPIKINHNYKLVTRSNRAPTANLQFTMEQRWVKKIRGWVAMASGEGYLLSSSWFRPRLLGRHTRPFIITLLECVCVCVRFFDPREMKWSWFNAKQSSHAVPHWLAFLNGHLSRDPKMNQPPLESSLISRWCS